MQRLPSSDNPNNVGPLSSYHPTFYFTTWWRWGMFWNCYIVRRFIKNKKKKEIPDFLQRRYHWRQWTTKPLFKLLFSHRNVPISKTIKQILEIRGTTGFFEIKKKVFLISIIDWKAVNMFVTFKKPQMKFSEKPNVFFKNPQNWDSAKAWMLQNHVAYALLCILCYWLKHDWAFGDLKSERWDMDSNAGSRWVYSGKMVVNFYWTPVS